MPDVVDLNFSIIVRAVVILCVLLFNVSGSQTIGEEQTIRRLREEFNRVIAAHDVEGLAKFWREDLHVTTGVGRQLAGRDAIRAAFATVFADPTFNTYTRTPDKIELNSSGIRAAESGHWTGQWKKPDGTMEWRGSYMSMWRKERGQWLLQSELYVLLNCTGSKDCAE